MHESMQAHSLQIADGHPAASADVNVADPGRTALVEVGNDNSSSSMAMLEASAKAAAVRPRRVLILVENLPSPFDRRVWQEACALRDAGYVVSIICPTGRGHESKFEVIGGIHIYRYNLPVEASGAVGYAVEYGVALGSTFGLALRIFFSRGFDVIHACNPPDLFFLIGGFFKLFGKKFLFDHHDLNPELYEAKFGRRDFLHRLMLALEYWTFRTADVSIATNESYKRIATDRGGMPSGRVFVVRSGPCLERLKILPPEEKLKQGRRFLVGYVGVMGKQEGIDYLLRAAHHIVHELGRSDVQFGLVGGGTSLDEMKAYAVELGVADFVTFTGRVPDSELLAMLNTADVCVNPDIANDMNDKSTMNKIMEYMALGKPIVQFDLTEGRYSAQLASLYARKNDAVDLAEKIIELLDDPARRAEMGRFGRRRVTNELEWRYEVTKLLAAYDALWPSALDTVPRPRAITDDDIVPGGMHGAERDSSPTGLGITGRGTPV
ncbi:MAG TPA: glycosyltransferase family 4 protein [Burkholderiales bacterium]|nr:glycosyltransferase family 4 protein [Burkholderiales bacterium]